MPGIAGTVSLPNRTEPCAPVIPGVGHPNQIPGGIGGLAPFPSRLLRPLLPVRGGTIRGGNNGPVVLYTPAVDQTAPGLIGRNEGFSVRSTDGQPIPWYRRFFANVAGQEGFIPVVSGTTGWTSNAPQGLGMPGSPIPFSDKHVNWGGSLMRTFFVNEQLFNQLTSRRRPWPIQKSTPRHLRVSRAQPIQQSPHPYQLTKYTPASSYGQTTRTLVSQGLQNLLPATNAASNPSTGTPYGSY